MGVSAVGAGVGIAVGVEDGAGVSAVGAGVGPAVGVEDGAGVSATGAGVGVADACVIVGDGLT